MGEFKLPLYTDYQRDSGEKWDECVLCGPRLYTSLLHFDSCSVEPTLGETVTGATSTNTGVVSKYVKTSGAYTDGDAAGVLFFTSPVGYDAVQYTHFQNNEALNGSTSGNDFATANGAGALQVSGRMIPEHDLIKHEGKYYCRPHYRFKFENQWKDEEEVDRSEGDRE